MTFHFVLTYFLITVTCSSIGCILLWQINSDMGTETEVNAFRKYVLWYLVFVFTNMVWIWINYGYLNISGWPFSMINLFAISAASYYWYKFIETRVNPAYTETLRFKHYSQIPLYIVLALIITTPITHWIFYYTADNQYIHGPLYPAMFVLALTYLIVATYHILKQLPHLKSKSTTVEYYYLASFLIFPIIAGLIDVFVPDLPVMELSLLFGTALIYTTLQQSQIYNDSLTQLSNRRLADKTLRLRLATCSEENPIYFFLADADYFKSVNDTYGHIKGDLALKLIANALRKFAETKHCFVARWGGDEFCVVTGNIDPETTMQEIKQHLDKESENFDVPLTLSIGYTKCTMPLSEITSVIDNADKMLYTNKKSMSR